MCYDWTNLNHATPLTFPREHVPIPQSLFWRRYTPDLLTTRIRKLSPQTKKVKGKAEQFTPLLEAQVLSTMFEDHRSQYLKPCPISSIIMCMTKLFAVAKFSCVICQDNNAFCVHVYECLWDSMLEVHYNNDFKFYILFICTVISYLCVLYVVPL